MTEVEIWNWNCLCPGCRNWATYGEAEHPPGGVYHVARLGALVYFHCPTCGIELTITLPYTRK